MAFSQDTWAVKFLRREYEPVSQVNCIASKGYL